MYHPSPFAAVTKPASTRKSPTSILAWSTTVRSTGPLRRRAQLPLLLLLLPLPPLILRHIPRRGETAETAVSSSARATTGFLLRLMEVPSLRWRREEETTKTTAGSPIRPTRTGSAWRRACTRCQQELSATTRPTSESERRTLFDYTLSEFFFMARGYTSVREAGRHQKATTARLCGRWCLSSRRVVLGTVSSSAPPGRCEAMWARCGHENTFLFFCLSSH